MENTKLYSAVKDAKFFHIQKSAAVLAFAVQENTL